MRYELTDFEWAATAPLAIIALSVGGRLAYPSYFPRDDEVVDALSRYRVRSIFMPLDQAHCVRVLMSEFRNF